MQLFGRYLSLLAIASVLPFAMGSAAADDAAPDPQAAEPEITVDASAEGAPMNEFIYAQFIEHLGRCIYGGIWAEMLEDRKFYYSVNAPQSQWDVIGGGVAMVSLNSFVGEHTPMARLPGGERRGIAQNGLHFQEGREYEGRVWLSGGTGGVPVEVSLIWGEGDDERETIVVEDIDREYVKTEFAFTAGGSTDDGRIEITSDGHGHFNVGTVSLMPADNVDGMRADTLELLKELDASMYRWPGGNFVSGYDWRDGVGDRDRRPPRLNPAWEGIEHNDFGLDEFMAFCRYLDAEPHIVTNTGSGELDLALAKLEYANGPADSPMGQKRAENGHEAPYDVEWWGVGNEMWGDWQIGYLPLEDYIPRHNTFAAAMLEADPSIIRVASGEVGSWSEGMLREAADSMEYIAEHFYIFQPRENVAAHMRAIPQRIRQIAEAHRRYREEIEGLADRDIHVAMTEWNYWYGPHLYGELGVQYFQKDGLGIAAGLHEFARQSDIIHMASYAQTVNVIGAIKTSPTDAVMETTGLVLTLYRRHFGSIPVETSVEAPFDAMAAWTEDGSALTVGVVNPTASAYTVPLSVEGAGLAGGAEGWTIAHDDPMAHNEPGQDPEITIESVEVTPEDGLPIAPYSVTVFRLPVE